MLRNFKDVHCVDDVRIFHATSPSLAAIGIRRHILIDDPSKYRFVRCLLLSLQTSVTVEKRQIKSNRHLAGYLSQMLWLPLQRPRNYEVSVGSINNVVLCAFRKLVDDRIGKRFESHQSDVTSHLDLQREWGKEILA